MNKVTIDCAAGQVTVDVCTQAESDALNALAVATNPAITARTVAEQLRADISAIVGQYRAKTTTEPVVGKMP